MPPTEPQREFMAILQKRLSIPDDVLDRYCRKTFGCPLVRLRVGQASELLDAMQEWKVAPAEIQRMKGQVDLPGLEGF